jgi:hypothetical protein
MLGLGHSGSSANNASRGGGCGNGGGRGYNNGGRGGGGRGYGGGGRNNGCANYTNNQRQGNNGGGGRGNCRMDLPGPTTSVGTRTDDSVGPWDYLACATRHLMA